MSASEMRVHWLKWHSDCPHGDVDQPCEVAALVAESASLRERLREAEKRVLTHESTTRGALDLMRTTEAAKSQALETAAREYDDHVLADTKVYCRHVAQRLRALSGSSAPQAAATPEDAEGGSRKGTE